MKLSFDEIKNIVFGAEQISQKEGYFCFHRFTESEKLAYSDSADFTRKTNATSGIRLDFCTDAKVLSFDYKMMNASSRDFVSFDIFINGIFSDTVTYTDAEAEIIGNYTKTLPAGKKRITIFLPNLYSMQIKNFVLEDVAFLKSYKHKTKIVSYGDSITQGYDARISSNSYINQLSYMLDGFVYNKAIGGDIFRPVLIEEKTFSPDMVTVAYGTNDWSKCSKEEFVRNMSSFIENIAANYKDSKIFVITPIWRKDNQKSVQFGTFDEMVTLISNECIKYENINVIKGQDILPHSDLLYKKDGLHPNDMGMLLYSSNLYREMLKVL